MTCSFVTRCCGEMHGIMDKKYRFLKKSPLDMEKLERYLEQIS